MTEGRDDVSHGLSQGAVLPSRSRDERVELQPRGQPGPCQTLWAPAVLPGHGRKYTERIGPTAIVRGDHVGLMLGELESAACRPTGRPGDSDYFVRLRSNPWSKRSSASHHRQDLKARGRHPGDGRE